MPKNKLEEKTYVRCKVREGIFSSEYYIGVLSLTGEYAAGFADKESVKIEREPQEGKTLEGLSQVHLIQEYKDKYLIQLPTEMQDRMFVSKDKLELFI